MAIDNSQVSIATSATLIYTADADGTTITVGGAAGDIWVGKSSVTTSGATGGLKVAAGAYLSIDLQPSEKLYGIASGSSVTVGYLVNGV